MARLLKLAALAALAIVLIHLLLRSEPKTPIEPVAAADLPEPVEVLSAGRPAEPVAERWSRLAAQTMGTVQSGRCGPYAWIGDVDDVLFLSACAQLAGQLDILYQQRFGLKPVGQPAETLFLFEDLQEYRRFVAGDPWVRGTHAGYASAARGFLALYVGDQGRGEVLRTLAHELTHLVQRRALGSDLPPWLSEGMADAIGDSASESGFAPLNDRAGRGVQSRRLRDARRQGQARLVLELVRLDRETFDREPVSFDYEQSALLLRFILSRPDLKAGFHQYLQELSRGRAYDPVAMALALGQEWTEIEARFWAWMDS